MRRALLWLLLLLVVALPVWAATRTTILIGAVTPILTLTNLTSNSTTAAGSTIDPTADGAGAGYLLCDVYADLTFSAVPTAGSAVQLWLFESTDGGSTFETNVHAAPYATFPVDTSGETTLTMVKNMVCPKRVFKAQAKNDNTGQAITTGTISILFATPQGQ